MPDQIIEATIETPEATPRRYRCRHIFTDGRRCGSPCLRGEELCYYHHTARQAARTRARDSGDSDATFEFPLPEDRTAIQTAIGEVLQRIAGCAIDNKRASLLLYGLQIASSNLARTAAAERDTAPVERVVTDPLLGYDLAPRSFLGASGEDIEEAEEVKEEPKEQNTRPQTITAIRKAYLRSLDRINKQIADAKSRSEAPPAPAAPEPAVLPNLQACAPSTHSQQIDADSCYPDLNHVKQTNRSHHPRRLGLPRRDQRQRHRACPQAHLRQAADHLSQHPHPRQ